MFCPHCHEDNPADAVFCGNCGQSMSPPTPVTDMPVNDTPAVPAQRSPVTALQKVACSPATLIVVALISLVTALLLIVVINSFSETTSITAGTDMEVTIDPLFKLGTTITSVGLILAMILLTIGMWYLAYGGCSTIANTHNGFAVLNIGLIAMIAVLTLSAILSIVSIVSEYQEFTKNIDSLLTGSTLSDARLRRLEAQRESVREAALKLTGGLLVAFGLFITLCAFLINTFRCFANSIRAVSGNTSFRVVPTGLVAAILSFIIAGFVLISYDSVITASSGTVEKLSYYSTIAFFVSIGIFCLHYRAVAKKIKASFPE